MSDPDHSLERRSFVGLAGLGVAGLLAGCAGGDTGGDPAVDSGADGDGGTDTDSGTDTGAAAACPETREDIEGPYYREDIPERAELDAAETEGTVLALSGLVLDADCQPIPGARVDFWQADVAGAYDLDSADADYYGWQETDADGRYALRTRVPGRYLNGAEYRPAHIHVKVFVDGVEVLTTQLYFEGNPYNEIDPWWSQETTLSLTDDGSGGLVASFDFAVA